MEQRVEHAEGRILGFQAQLGQLDIGPAMYLQLREDLDNTQKPLANTRTRLRFAATVNGTNRPRGLRSTSCTSGAAHSGQDFSKRSSRSRDRFGSKPASTGMPTVGTRGPRAAQPPRRNLRRRSSGCGRMAVELHRHHAGGEDSAVAVSLDNERIPGHRDHDPLPREVVE